MGPGICSLQWTMEQTIGNLGEEVKQHSNPFSNLSQRGLRWSQINALKAMVPDLEPPENHVPRGSLDLGHGYVLLRAQDRTPQVLSHVEAMALEAHLLEAGSTQSYSTVVRWARLRLPNGQIARSMWKEGMKELHQIRISRNVKV